MFEWTVRAWSIAWCAFSAWQGIAICWGGPPRWSARSYEFISLVPGSPYTWGITIGVLGAASVVALWAKQHNISATLMIGLAVWMAIFGAGGAMAAASHPEATVTGPGWLFMCSAQVLALASTRIYMTRLAKNNLVPA